MHKSKLAGFIIDCRTDDIEALVQRLEALGARRVQQFPRWWVMEAPTGQRFCVARAQSPDFGRLATQWPFEASSPMNMPMQWVFRITGIAMVRAVPISVSAFPPPSIRKHADDQRRVPRFLPRLR